MGTSLITDSPEKPLPRGLRKYYTITDSINDGKEVAVYKATPCITDYSVHDSTCAGAPTQYRPVFLAPNTPRIGKSQKWNRRRHKKRCQKELSRWREAMGRLTQIGSDLIKCKLRERSFMEVLTRGGILLGG